MKNFNSFVSDKGVLHVQKEEDTEDIFSNGDSQEEIQDEELEEDTPWSLTIDMQEQWKKYENSQISLKDFNNLYFNTLSNNKQDIVNIDAECWNTIVPEINKLINLNEQEQSEKIYNKLYDIFDKYEIKIQIENENLE